MRYTIYKNQHRLPRQGLRRVVRARSNLRIEARNVILFSKREAARAGIVLPATDARAQHISKHLKSQEGDSVRVGIVNGLKGSALVKSVSGEGVRLAWNTWQDPPPLAPVALVLAMPRPRALKRLWRQLAELGISRVVLTITDTVPDGYSCSEALRPHIVMREVLQGLEQAGDTLSPEIVLEPSLSAAMSVAEGPWGSPDQDGPADGCVAKEWGPRRTLVPSAPIMQRSQAIRSAPLPHAGQLTPLGLSSAVASSAIPARSPASSAKPRTELAADITGKQRTSQAGNGGSDLSAETTETGDGNGSQRERLAFITQCLQVRSRQHEERWWNASSPRADVPYSNGGNDQKGQTPPGVLRVMCHPQDQCELLSDIVVRYSLQLQSYGSCAWNHSPSNSSDGDKTAVAGTPEAQAPGAAASSDPQDSLCNDTISNKDDSGTASESSVGGAGDYYYGSADPSVEGAGPFDESSFIGMCTEALNIMDRNSYSSATAVAASAGLSSDNDDDDETRRESLESSGHASGAESSEVQQFDENSHTTSVPLRHKRRSGSTAPVGTTAVTGKDWGNGHVVVAIGPERGWSAKEVALLESRGYFSARMGSRILSSPTAVVSAVAVVQEALR